MFEKMTIAGLIARLKCYPEGALCVGSFWLDDDFLALDGALTADEIEAAMEIVHDNHDANFGINWDVIQHAIDIVKAEG
ncbi:Uncharacterised protein [Serratia proteamaculans]|uniref:hypothetical protein n=1 Tax=Serratia TaxID=613 RepID=UPI0021798D0A|nr:MULTISPECIES: hypothetical protein [Serratia]CAI1228440.1 Uncharacterised protein [Serratia quinivorans]CAI2019347.1 Uncharacterised protein [Serratia proteamaculans]CAI2158840.1 Uncharacterised protein [Serratia quinivorans]